MLIEKGLQLPLKRFIITYIISDFFEIIIEQDEDFEWNVQA